jgi:uncharacterized delta-60 repeat protein
MKSQSKLQMKFNRSISLFILMILRFAAADYDRIRAAKGLKKNFKGNRKFMKHQFRILNRVSVKIIGRKLRARAAFAFAFVLVFLMMSATLTKAAGSHLDFGFNGSGKATVDFGGNDEPYAIAEQADEKIVVVGRSANGSDSDFAIARFNATGTLDTTFDGDGKVTTDFFGSFDDARAVIIQPDGKIVVAGATFVSGHYNFAVARYNANGSLDTTFSGNGKNNFNFSGDSDVGYAAALQADGKIVIAGYASDPSLGHIWAIARLNTNGTLDSTFGTNGKATIRFGFSVAGVVIQPDGKIVVGGDAILTLISNRDLAVARFNPNGSLDTSFGNAGVQTTDISGGDDDFAGGLTMLPDGRPILTGYWTDTFAQYRLEIACYTAGGTLDPRFGTDGKIYRPLGERGGGAAALVNGDEIVVANNNEFGVLRFKPNGMPDPTFGTGGKATTRFFGSAANTLTLQTDGQIIAAGSISTGGNTDFAVARYNRISTAVNSDFSRDGHADFAVFRPSSGVWSILNSVYGEISDIPWGQAGDIPVPGDYDRDGRTDAAVFRPSTGQWWIHRSLTNSNLIIQFGLNGDKPVAADYDGDGFTDIAVYRPSDGTWYLQRSRLGFAAYHFGISTDTPVPADYDGDGLTDFAVFRPSTGFWYLQRSTAGFFYDSFGLNGDRPTPADYDADGIADISVWRPSNGVWYVRNANGGASSIKWGVDGDIPAPSDFDGDGRVEYTVFRPSTGVWYIFVSSLNIYGTVSFGTNGDTPINSVYVP